MKPKNVLELYVAETKRVDALPPAEFAAHARVMIQRFQTELKELIACGPGKSKSWDDHNEEIAEVRGSIAFWEDEMECRTGLLY